MLFFNASSEFIDAFKRIGMNAMFVYVMAAGESLQDLLMGGIMMTLKINGYIHLN